MPSIGCKYCDWKTPVWITTKRGIRSSGWKRLAFHIRDKHPEHEEEAERLVADEREVTHA
jgi:hypothetical protein